jgi:hypothetical protein
MPPERRQHAVALEEIVSNAKEVMFKDGNHVPTVIMESSTAIVIGQIPEFPPTHGERLQLMNFLGMAAARSGRVDQLHQVFMISEGWLSESSKEDGPRLAPSEDPKRKEVLLVSAVQVMEHTKQLKVLEITRDEDERVLSLDEFIPGEPKDISVDTPLLDAFIQGFRQAFQTKFN